MKKRLFSAVVCTFLCVVTLLSVLLLAGCNNKPTLGTWWWSASLGDEYLDFASANNVTEIYYCSSKFNESTDTFIDKAKRKGIKVYWLAGEYQWVENPASLRRQLDKYVTYQNTYKNKFSGVHFDIEPQQHKEWKTRRKDLLEKFIKMAYDLKQDYDVYIEYDIQFSWEDEIEFMGVTKPAFAHVIDNADRVTIMSYRDTAEKIYSVAKAEIEYAISQHKTLNLGVETKSSEGDQVSFMEEGKEYMYAELAKLRTMIPKDFGIVIHQIKQWYELKD